MKRCEDFEALIHELANHTGNKRWCEDCFDLGLCKDMKDHSDRFFADDFAKKEGSDD